MAVGDVVSGISAAATILTFQPAIGSECLITEVPNGFGLHLTNGVSLGAATGANAVVKIFINNTNYLQIAAGGAGSFSWFTGIQIK